MQSRLGLLKRRVPMIFAGKGPKAMLSAGAVEGSTPGHADVASSDKFHFGTEVEKVEVYPRYYIALGDAELTAKKMPLEKIEPTPRSIFEWNGRKYPYPYRGLMIEENGPAVIKWLYEQGHVNPDGYLKTGGIKKYQRNKVLQYWFQAHPDRPTHMMLAYDPYLYNLFIVLSICVVLIALYFSYDMAVVPEKNLLRYENWKRWNKEHH